MIFGTKIIMRGFFSVVITMKAWHAFKALSALDYGVLQILSQEQGSTLKACYALKGPILSFWETVKKIIIWKYF